MGLRKIVQNDKTSYMYSSSSEEELRLVLLQGGAAHAATITPESDSVQRWCRNLEKTPQEYLTLASQAVENLSSVHNTDGKDLKEDIFEIQDGHLVWKQYFPEKKVYGRRGKFALEKIEHNDALEKIMNGVIGDLTANVQTIDKLTSDLQRKEEEVKKAADLVEKSVKMKEDFEKVIYGKCASIINMKKLRMRQLSNQSSTAGKSNDTTLIAKDKASDSPSKGSKANSSDSECYNSDTDVDDPDKDDVDTDEEIRMSISPRKQGRNGNTQTAKKSVPAKRVIDSQDDLFNNSIEAELYPTTTSDKKRKTTRENVGRSRINDSQTKSTSEKVASTQQTQEERKSNPSASFQDGSQNSILDELF
ncbi:uncharacterized protein LOC122255694 isoform X2 [Penaeus japonicus]|uniref:uncharacterized protein LOC122255694 isoform X2 n=1 Tax=Penaeus japonicus TaxID=27405 RepID=UPI001C716F59|nr:uncharacterized protein LOC122255694 isoform X2 [Penaeus japonicus]